MATRSSYVAAWNKDKAGYNKAGRAATKSRAQARANDPVPF